MGSKIIYPSIPPDDSVTQDKIADDAVGTGELIDDDVKSVDIGDGEVKTADIGDGEVKTLDLDTDAVTTLKIKDAAVTMAKHADMAQGTVTGRPRGAGAGVPSALDEDALAAIKGLVTSDPNGIVDTADSTLTWSDAGPDRTLTIAPVAASYDVWVAGVKRTISGSLSTQIAPTEGLHYIYIDSAGALQNTTTETDSLYLSEALVAIIYWDAANNRGRPYNDRHGHLMPGITHLRWHRAFGARWTGGLGLADILADESGALATHAQFSLGSGSFVDEDIQHVVAGRAAPASTRVYYREGATGAWRWDAATDYPLKVTATPLAAWNEFFGGVWQQTEVSNNQYTLTHAYATGDTLDDIAIIQGQADYQTKALARAGAERELANLQLGGLPAPEMVAIASFIWQTRTSYGNAVQSRLVSTDEGDDYLDWRARQVASAGSADGPITNVDGQMWIPAVDGRNQAGAWGTTTGVNSNLAKRRTAAATTDSWVCSANIPTRSTAGRGRRITSVRMVYSVTTAAVDDVQIRCWRQTVPADGNAMAALGLVAGGSGAAYDDDHNTALKRGADNGAGGIRYHTSTAIPVTTAYLGDGEGVMLYCLVIDTAPNTGVVDVYGFLIEYTETLVP